MAINPNTIKAAPIYHTLVLVNNFLVNSTSFLNSFSENIEKKLSKISSKVTDVETLLAVVEAKLNSIPDLDTSSIENKSNSSISNNTANQNTEKSTPSNPQQNISTSTSNIEQVTEEKEQIKIEDPAIAGKVKASEHPDYMPFLKLLKVGVPIPVVANKLILAGLDASVVDQPDKYIDL